MTRDEVLYRKKPNGRYEPVVVDTDCGRFPEGRWVLVAGPCDHGSWGCCRKALPNVDDALLASLQHFRRTLEKCLLEASRASVTGGLSKKELAEIQAIIGKHRMVTITIPAAGDVADRAVEAFAREVLGGTK